MFVDSEGSLEMCNSEGTSTAGYLVVLEEVMSERLPERSKVVAKQCWERGAGGVVPKRRGVRSVQREVATAAWTVMH